MTRSTWSGGVTWSGTAKWMPDGLTASGPLMPSIAIGGTLRTDCMAASWRLGINGFLDGLTPGTCSISLAGRLDTLPGTTIVISVPDGTLWSGRVDTCVVRYDSASNEWTTITGTDNVGALGEAKLYDFTMTSGNLESVVEAMASTAGVVLDIVDQSSGLPDISSAYVDPFTGSLLDYLNEAAKSSNAMVGLRRDGTVAVVMREAVTPSDQVDITNRYSEWLDTYSIVVDINKWIVPNGGNNHFLAGTDDADIAIYGERTYESSSFQTDPALTHFADWIAYGGSQRFTSQQTFPLRSWDDSDLMLLNPFDWVSESSTDYQVMSVQHDATPDLWTVTLTTDQLLSLL